MLIRILLSLALFMLAACTSGPTPSATPSTAPRPSDTAVLPAPTPAATDAPSPETAAPTATSIAASTAAPPTLQAGTWVQRSSMSHPRSEMPAAALDGLIYVPGGFGVTDVGLIGGTATLEGYDPAADVWRTLAPMPQPRHHLMAVAHNGKLYIFGGAQGGFSPTATAWVYDPAADAWADLAPLPEPRMSGAAVALGDYLYV
ncbi:MAG: kelch repeat-containing protein, partial [Anaerolineales bacterium]